MSGVGDCRHCKSWTGCPGNKWYSFAEIRWCPQQMFWILKYAEQLETGVWPEASAAESAGVTAQGIKREGYFVKAVLIVAQIRYRLKQTGWRGRLLAEESINREKMLYLSDDAKSALYYISGNKPKTRKFGLWLAGREYKRDKITPQNRYLG